MKFADLPIQRKLMLILLLTSGAVLLVTSAGIATYEYFNFRRSLVAETKTLATILADNSTASLAFKNETDAAEILSALKAQPSVIAAALYTTDNRLFAVYPETLAAHSLPTVPGSPGARFEDDFLIIYQPVEEDGVRQGTLYMKTDLKAARERFVLYAGIVLLVLIFSFLIALVLSSVLQKRISAPVLSLAETARAVSDRKDYSVRALTFSNDELGTLTNSFNYMLDQIQQRDVALSESEERLNLALRSSGVGTWSWDVKTDDVLWDQYVPMLFGMHSDGPLRIKYDDFINRVNPADRESVNLRVAQAVQTLGSFEAEFRVVWPDESVHVLVSKGKAYSDETGQAHRLTGVCYDISDRKRAEEALKVTAEELSRSNADLEQFAYVASHDLQEPLRAVAGCVQLLEKRYGSKLDADADELIRHTVDASKRMQKLIHDLLAYSRLGRKTKPPEAQDTNSILRDVLADLKPAISRKGAAVYAETLPSVTIDSTQLSQLFQNLIGNALKFTDKRRPEIRVGANRNGKEWIFFVQDNGMGIEPQYKDRIFLLFQRLHTRREYPGTGIGLAICKRVVEQRGGRIWLESTPGEGSTFFFTIPDPE